MARKLDEVIESIQLPEDTFKVMTTDNAANMKVACRESTTITQGFTCFAHTLNLVVNNGIKKVAKIQVAMEQFKKLAGACHKSTLHCERIRRECGDLNKSGTTPVNYIKIIQPVETRWNSALIMVKSIIQLRPALEAIRESSGRSTDPHLIELIPDSEEFDLMDSLIDQLTKFEEVSTFMSSESNPTICWIIQKVFYLQTTLSNTIAGAQGLDDDSLR